MNKKDNSRIEYLERRCEELNRVIYEIEHTEFTVTVDDVCSLVSAKAGDGMQAPEVYIREIKNIEFSDEGQDMKRLKFTIKHPNTYY